jgi:CRP-like cAMP-binding protein
MTSISALQPFLTKLEKLAVLGPEDRAAILALPHTVRRSPRGHALAHQDGDPSLCFAVLSGIVGRTKLLADGTRQIISVHLAGEGVDLHKAVSAEATHGVIALTDAEVAVIGASALGALLDRPQIRAAVMREIVHDGAIQREWTVNVGRRNARCRLAHFLCEMGWRMEAAGIGTADDFVIPLTQEHLADITGLTTVHVNRTLQGLRAEGTMARSTRPLTVIDPQALIAAANFDDKYLKMPCWCRRPDGTAGTRRLRRTGWGPPIRPPKSPPEFVPT